MIKFTEEFVDVALDLADAERAKINERERELFGLSSVRLRALLNNLCTLKNTRYLELGVYKGATLLSAVYGNPTCKAVGVENYKYDEREFKRTAPEGQIWENMKSQLRSNIERYNVFESPIITDNIQIIEEDFATIDWSKHQKFDICFYDITPTSAEAYQAFFEKTMSAMSNDCLVIFSNYSNVKHAKELDESVAKYADKYSVAWKKQRISGGMSDATKYYSGITILNIKRVAGKANA